MSKEAELARKVAELEKAQTRMHVMGQLSRQLNSVRTKEALLDVVSQPARDAGVFRTTLTYVDLDADGDLEWLEAVACWEAEGEPSVPVGRRYHVSEFPLAPLYKQPMQSAQFITDVTTDHRVSEDVRDALEQVGVGALVLIPLILAGRWIGMLTFHWAKPREFTEEEMQIWQAFIGVVSPVVESNRLTEKAQARAEELGVLNELGQALTSHLTVEDVVEETYRQASRLLDTTSFYIALYDSQADRVSFPLAVEKGERVQWASRQARHGLTEYVIQNRRSVLIREDVAAHLEELGIEVIGDEAASWLGVPLVIASRVLGMIGVQSYAQPHAYGEHERDLLVSIASQATIALQNAQLFEEAQRRVQEMALLHDVSLAAASGTRLEETLELAAEALADAYENALVAFMLVDPEDQSLYLAVGVGYPEAVSQEKRIPAGEGVTGWVVQHNEPVLVPDMSQDSRCLSLDEVDVESCSELCVPLSTGTRVLGALNIESPQVNAFTADDQRLLSTLASNLAAQIERARLFEHMEQAVEARTQDLRDSMEEQERLQQEIIDTQQQTLQELATPIIPVMEAPGGGGSIIVMPLIGSIDSMRARDITRVLLSGISENRAKVVILDITGVHIVDSGVANHLNKTIHAARLKGARTIVTGISDAVAETIVDLGIDWSNIETLANLQTGLRAALLKMGLEIVPRSKRRTRKKMGRTSDERQEKRQAQKQRAS